MSGFTDPVQALFQAGALTHSPFPPNSRYHGLPLRQFVRPDGTTVAHLPRRVIPPTAAFTAIGEHLVVQGDRLDRIAAATIGDAEQFWRLCDANGALAPEELTATPGRRLRITLAAGMGGG
ncbi:hypothetical protein ACQW02_05100 [Humitalea sp. 24SJ18S-53]|uniref:hypothetical protein n=1 Tax=Humitalea sp. 24SJ18S-53 TaxID=3422307 RepID=UPI003D673EE3